MSSQKQQSLIAIVILIIFTGCAKTEHPLGASKTVAETVIPPTATVTPLTPTPTPTPTTLGTESVGIFYETGVTPGDLRTYTHYPSYHILYDEIHVDDRLEKVEYICQDQRYDITTSFRSQNAEGEIPTLYSSWQINLRPFCYIAFTVVNISGETIGMEFASHCILCYE